MVRIGILGLVILLFAGPVQDTAWLGKVASFCEARDPGRAGALRRELAAIKGSDPIRTGVQNVLLYVSIEKEARAKKWIKALGKYASGMRGSTNDAAGHLRGVEFSVSLGDVGRIMAFAHMEAYLAAGGRFKALKPFAKKLKLELMTLDRYGTPEGKTVAAIKRINIKELGNTGNKARNFFVRYARAFAYIRGLDEHPNGLETAREAISACRKEVPEHVEELLKALSPFHMCTSCGGRKQIQCYACEGTKMRKIVCPECGGKGTIKARKAPPREPGGQDRIVNYCPACIGRARVQRVPCDFCTETGIVECQRCKYWKVPLKMIADVEECKHCEGSGFPFKSIVHPCAFCKGTGGFLVPLDNPDLTVGPMD